MTTISDQDFINKVEEVKQRGATSIHIGDNNNQAWNSGYAHWLMENFFYINGTNHFIAYINRPKVNPTLN